MEGFAPGFLGAMQAQNEAAKTEVERRQLGIQLQELDMRRQKAAQDLVKENGARLETMGNALGEVIKSVGPQFQVGSELDKQLDQWKGMYANWLRMSGQDPEQASVLAEGYRALAKVPQRVQASAGTNILQVQPDGSLKTIAAVPPNPPAVIQGAQFAFPNDPERQRQFVANSTNQASASRFRAAGPYIDDNGNVIGEGVFDGQTGQTMLRVGDEMQPMPKGAKPATENSLSRNALTGEQFIKLADQAKVSEQSVRRVQEYMKTVKQRGQGFDYLADAFIGQAKTLLGQAINDPAQFAALASSGQLQGLIGRFREEVVGGGVMTEQDALRVISALGGSGALLNKEIVADFIRKLLRDKVEDYNQRLVPAYNQQIKETNRGAGFKEKQPIEIDPTLFEVGAADSGSYSTADAVKAAYQAGKLTRDQAAKILREKGWAQ